VSGFVVFVDLADGYRESYRAATGDELLTVVESVLESKSFVGIEVIPVAVPITAPAQIRGNNGGSATDTVFDEATRFVACQATRRGVRCDRAVNHPGDHASAQNEMRWAAT
jgi:hypothetical protein